MKLPVTAMAAYNLGRSTVFPREQGQVHPHLLLIVPLVAVMVIASWRPALAQEATPTPDLLHSAFPMTPDPADCRVEQRRSVDEFIAIVQQATPRAAATQPTSVEVPVGPQADAATVEAIVALVREQFACFNAGDYAAAYSLFTEGALRGFQEVDPLAEADLRGLMGATPRAVPPEARGSVLAMTDPMALADGRVGAFFVVQDPGVPPRTEYVVFARQDRTWLIDGITTFAPFVSPGDDGQLTGTPPA